MPEKHWFSREFGHWEIDSVLGKENANGTDGCCSDREEIAFLSVGKSQEPFGRSFDKFSKELFLKFENEYSKVFLKRLLAIKDQNLKIFSAWKQNVSALASHIPISKSEYILLILHLLMPLESYWQVIPLTIFWGKIIKNAILSTQIEYSIFYKNPHKWSVVKDKHLCGFGSLWWGNAIRTYALETLPFYKLLLN